MPVRLQIDDDASIELEELVDACHAVGDALPTVDGLAQVAPMLRRLGNNRRLVGDRLIAMLKDAKSSRTGGTYSPQVIMLYPPDRHLFMRANIWPSLNDPMLKSAGASAFFYGMPHDHAFNFLTLGYHGPGYWSDYYEVEGGSEGLIPGDRVPLRFIERSRLAEGQMLIYRANVDIHDQQPADALSLSINVMPLSAAHAWRDQYLFDVRTGDVVDRLTTNSARMMMMLCVHFGGDNAIDLAMETLRGHPDDMMRIAAFDALCRESSVDARHSWSEMALALNRPVVARHVAMSLQNGYDASGVALEPTPA